jgi:hypothetical protein
MNRWSRASSPSPAMAHAGATLGWTDAARHRHPTRQSVAVVDRDRGILSEVNKRTPSSCEVIGEAILAAIDGVAASRSPALGDRRRNGPRPLHPAQLGIAAAQAFAFSASRPRAGGEP